MTQNTTNRLGTEANLGAEASLDTVTEPRKAGEVQPIPLKAQALPLSWAKTDRRPLARRRVRLDWYTLAVVLLMLASAALCFYRLMWAIQP